MQLQFSLLQLLLAMVGFAAPLAFFARYKSVAIDWCALLSSCAAFALILIARKGDIGRIYNSALFGGMGASFFGVMATTAFGPLQDGVLWAICLAVAGTIALWLSGCAVLRGDGRIVAIPVAALPVPRVEDQHEK